MHKMVLKDKICLKKLSICCQTINYEQLRKDMEN
jgi:hypothetical protein